MALTAGERFEQQLDRLLDGLQEEIATLTRRLIELVRACQPGFSPQVKFGWRSVNFRHPQAGFVCAVFPHRDRVELVFEHGRQLSDPERLLEGDHAQIRVMNLRPGDTLPRKGIALLLVEALALKG